MAKTYKAAFDAMFSEAVDIWPFGVDGAMVKALDREVIRREFYASYATDARRQ